MKKFFLGFILALAISIPLLAYGQDSTQTLLNLWKVVSNYILPRTSTYGLQIPSLGSTGNPCVKVDSTGKFATTTCGSGSSFTTTTINSLSTTAYTFTAGSGISISTSAPGTITFTNTAAGGGATTTITTNVQSNGPDFTFATSSTGSGVLNITGSGSTVTFRLDTSTLQPAGSYVTNAYASSTFPSFSYTTSTYATIANYPNYTYASSTLVNFTYATNTFATIANYPTYTYSSSTLPSFIYASSSYATLWNLKAGTQITISTSSGVTITNAYGSAIDPTELASSDFGDFTCNGSTCTLDASYVTNTYASSTFPSFSYASSTFLSGIVPITNGGTGTSTTPSDGAVLLGNGSVWLYSVVPQCTSGQKIQYTTASRAFTCATDQTGGGGGTTTTIASNITIEGPDFTLATGSATGLDLRITGSGTTHTFTPVLQTGYVIPLQSTLDTYSTYAYGTSTYVNFTYATNTFATIANYPTYTYASSSYLTLWNSIAGTNITITTSSNPTISVVNSPSFSGTLGVTGTSTLATSTITRLGIATTTPFVPLVVVGSTTITSLNAASCDVMADGNGGLFCGTNGAGGGEVSYAYGSSSYATLWNIKQGTGITISTSSGVTITNALGASIDPTELSNTDFGDFSCNGTTCTLDTAYVPHTYASSTFPSFTYASSTYAVLSANNVFTGTNTFSATTTMATTTITRLGIGTTTPFISLVVVGSSSISSLGAGLVRTTAAGQLFNGLVGAADLNADYGDFTCNGSTCTIDNSVVNLTTKVTGILPVANGGTGVPSLTSNLILFGNGTNPVATSSVFVWDNANTRHGVGSATPIATLSVKGAGVGTVHPFIVSSSTDSQLFKVAANGTTTINSLGTGPVYSSSGDLYNNGTTGTGIVVQQTSPTLVTPILGTASGTALSLSGQLWVTGSTTLAGLSASNIFDTGATSCTNLQTTAAGLLQCNSTAYLTTIGSGALGKVARWNGANTLTDGLFYDNGTVTGVSATSSSIMFNVQGTGSLDPFQAGTSTKTSMLIVKGNTGNVGIGTSTPPALFTVDAGTAYGTASTTVVIPQKFQIDTYNSAGTRVCLTIVGTTPTVTTGACP